MRVRSRVCVILRCSSEAVKNLWEAMSVVCTACIRYVWELYFLHAFLKFKRGMPTVSAMATPLLDILLRIYSAVIRVLAINSRKMKEMVDFFFVLQ